MSENLILYLAIWIGAGLFGVLILAVDIWLCGEDIKMNDILPAIGLIIIAPITVILAISYVILKFQGKAQDIILIKGRKK